MLVLYRHPSEVESTNIFGKYNKIESATKNCPCYSGTVIIHSAKKKNTWTLMTVPFSQKMLYIRQIKSLLCEVGECPLHFDTKLEGIG